VKIGIDATLLSEDRITGVKRYTVNLIKSLIEIDESDQYFVFFKKRILSQLVYLVLRLEVYISPFKNRILTYQLWLAYVEEKLKLDILH